MVTLRRAIRSKTTLPLIRRKLKDYGNIAIRGSNEIHEKNQKQLDHRNGTYIPFHNSVIVDSSLLSKESTRNYISRIGNSVITALGYAFSYSGFEYTLDKHHHPKIKYDVKNKPTIVVSFNSKARIKQSINIGNVYELKGENRKQDSGEKSTDIHAKSKDTHYITIDKEDVIDLTKAWKLKLAKQGKILGYNIMFTNFLNNFLARRVISKALKAHRSSKKN